MMYCSCKYAPAELLAGFGVEVERLDPSPAAFTCSESCTHPNMCSFAKAMIEEVQEKGVRELILTDCCDAMRRVYDALRVTQCTAMEQGGNGSRQASAVGSTLDFLWLLPLPHRNGEREIHQFSAELKKLTEAYSRYSGRSFDAEQAVEAYCRQQETGESSFLSGIETGEPVDAHGGEGADSPAAGKEGNIESPGSLEQKAGPYIRVAGAHGGRRLIELTQQVFPDLSVVDDTCSGNRYLDRTPGRPEDFFNWYAEALLDQPHACMRMLRPVPTGESGQQPVGTIFHTIKFCDYYGFEYMMLPRKNRDRMIRIETDTTGSGAGQLRTRLEAFREELDSDGVHGSGRNHLKGIHPDCGTGIETGTAGRPDIQHGRISEAAQGTGSLNGINHNDTLKEIFVAGIDSGSASTDCVIMNGKQQILAKVVLPTAAGAENSSEAALQKALAAAGLDREQLTAIVTTGYGRSNIAASDQAVTEITCHARGAHFLHPAVRTVIDIGGQDSKVIRIDENGKVENFTMNDKCAAGTGRFLEMQARTLGLSMEEMSAAGLRWQKDLTITSMCTVFAESEVVSLIAANTPAADIIHGLNKSIARRTAALAARVGGQAPYMMTGGVARNAGVVKCLEEELGQKIFVSEDSQVCGAIGACLSAL